MANPNPSPSSRFKPGQSGNPGGRKKGPVSKVKEILSAKGQHPVEEILRLLPELRPAERAKIWLELLAYCEARPKETEADKPDGEDERLTPEQLKALTVVARGTHP